MTILLGAAFLLLLLLFPEPALAFGPATHLRLGFEVLEQSEPDGARLTERRRFPPVGSSGGKSENAFLR